MTFFSLFFISDLFLGRGEDCRYSARNRGADVSVLKLLQMQLTEKQSGETDGAARLNPSVAFELRVGEDGGSGAGGPEDSVHTESPEWTLV